MLRFIGILIFAGVLITMIQPFSTQEKLNLTAGKNSLSADSHWQPQTQISSIYKPQSEQQATLLRNELISSFKQAQINESTHRIMIETRVEMDEPTMRPVSIDETTYDQSEKTESEQQSNNEQDMMQELETASLSTEQNQLIINKIVEANLDQSLMSP